MSDTTRIDVDSGCSHAASAAIAALRMYEARDSVRDLFGDNYPTVIAEYQSLIEGRMKADPSLDILSAALALGKDAQRAGFGGSVLSITAAAVEMIERSYAPLDLVRKTCADHARQLAAVHPATTNVAPLEKTPEIPRQSPKNRKSEVQ